MANTELTTSMKHTIEHKTLKIDRTEIHYQVAGKENWDVILFLHPAFSDHRAFDLQIDFFSTHYCVISFDFIGHGLSKANKSKAKIDASSEHILRILEVERKERAHLVGVSMGSLLAQYFAILYTEKVKSLTAVGGYDINSINKEVGKAQGLTKLGLMVRAIFSMKSFRQKTAQISCYTKKGQALFMEASSRYERKSFMVMPGLQQVVQDRKNHKPPYATLIVTGEFEIDLAHSIAKDWNANLDNSEYRMIMGAGHCANMDKPLEFNELLKEFIDRNNN